MGTTTMRGVSLPKELDERLIEHARQQDKKISTIVRRALEKYFEEWDATQQNPYPLKHY